MVSLDKESLLLCLSFNINIRLVRGQKWLSFRKLAQAKNGKLFSPTRVKNLRYRVISPRPPGNHLPQQFPEIAPASFETPRPPRCL